MIIKDRSQLELELECLNIELIGLKWSCTDLKRQLKKAKTEGEESEFKYYIFAEEDEREKVRAKRDGIRELLELGVSLILVGGK